MHNIVNHLNRKTDSNGFMEVPDAIDEDELPFRN